MHHLLKKIQNISPKVFSGNLHQKCPMCGMRIKNRSRTCFRTMSVYTLSTGTNHNKIMINSANKTYNYHLHNFGYTHVPKVNYCTEKSISEKMENDTNSKSRFNPINIQMLSEALHRQIFRDSSGSQDKVDLDPNVKDHLDYHGLWAKPTTILPEVEFQLPEMLGNNINDHFRKLAWKQTEPYRLYGNQLAHNSLPPLPKKWKFSAGWTRYDADGTNHSVPFPDEGGLIFDVEVLVPEGDYPTLATAASPNAWYSWCSRRLIEDQFQWSQQPSLDDLITMEAKRQDKTKETPWKPRLIIGHNVSYDRSYIKEQYLIKGSETCFLDTMALHIAISGFSSIQRMLWMAKKSGSQRKEVKDMEKKKMMFGSGVPDMYWMRRGSLNNLNDVYQLHCKDQQPLDKAVRNIFVEGTMPQIRQQFQELMAYCASDVKATHSVFSKLWPQFFKRFPHPVTLSGMLQMSTTYLPVNQNWQRYIEESSATYADLQHELKFSLMQLANDACQLMHDKKYKEDPWLFDLDWSTRNLSLKKLAMKKLEKDMKKKNEEKGDGEEEETAKDRVDRILTTAESLPKTNNHMPGYPRWYKELCCRDKDEDWIAGPSKISTQVRVTPKLLRLLWDGFPVYYDAKYGWGYLVGLRTDNIGKNPNKFPIDVVNKLTMEAIKTLPVIDDEGLKLQQLIQRLSSKMDELDTLGENISGYFSKLRSAEEQLQRIEQKKKKTESWQKPASSSGPAFHRGDGPYNDVNIPGCWFFKIPHKDGEENRVGNPLAKDYLSKTEDGMLRALSGSQAEAVLKLSKMCSYWKNNEERIKSQIVVPLRKDCLPNSVTENVAFDESNFYGALLPRLVTAGTVTRRAVEKTWLTASNAYPDRVGSELKSMIQSPPGYHFVGADVDSQELWIASILGDAHFAGLHGCTAFGWMTLQGQKRQGTDLHSKTAATVGITRDHAKVMNYGRIYGAGQPFAERLLMQFNPRLSRQEASMKARAMYASTKGTRKRKRRSKLLDSESVNFDDDAPSEESEDKASVWQGGSESHMFNRLEAIANSKHPKTPILGASITASLEPAVVGTDFMTSRVNWVVQSSAVDYLHLMLVAMKWLFKKYNIDGRFCISIHDEVRYLVKSEDRYRAALALQIANILTRSMFAYQLDMQDLPQSVAFFSAVDIDTCMRKEVTMDCKTPSNPHGLQRGYNVPPGEALNIYEILKKTASSLDASKQP